ncbi:MAG: hypothetical protein AAGI71_05380 [Bacteroidota bacterium]
MTRRTVCTTLFALFFLATPLMAQPLAVQLREVPTETTKRASAERSLLWYENAAQRLAQDLSEGHRTELHRLITGHYDLAATHDLDAYFDILAEAYGSLESFEVIGTRPHATRLGKVETFVMARFEARPALMRFVWKDGLLVTVTHEAM